VGVSVDTSEAEVVATSATQIREKAARIRWSDRSPEGVVVVVIVLEVAVV
jgi:S-adenosylmethionine/arginine decarboxylase-like enzyme